MIRTRVIETAIDENGLSYIFSDKQQTSWELAGHNITEFFFSSSTPPQMMESSGILEDKSFNLKPGELRFFRSDIPPTQPIYDSLPNEQKPNNIRDLFYHSTTTIDYIVVVKGKVELVVGNTQVQLKQGDVIIQRGAAHAWHNHTKEFATIIVLMIGVEPPPTFTQIDPIKPD